MQNENILVFPTKNGLASPILAETIQGMTAPYVVYCRFSDGSALDLTGFTLSWQYWLPDSPEAVYTATGTLVADETDGSKLTYTPSAADTAAPGEYLMHVIASDGVTIYKSDPTTWLINDDPGQEDGGVTMTTVPIAASGFWMQDETIDAGQSVEIPTGHQMVVWDGLTVDGELIVNGQLITPAS